MKWLIAALGAAVGILLLKLLGLESFLIYILALWAASGGWVINLMRKKLTLSHILAIVITWSGVALTGCSYYLAFIGSTDNLQTLSTTVVIEMVGGVGGYFVKAGIENAIREKAKKANMPPDNDTV